jgi:hypothetical protein
MPAAVALRRLPPRDDHQPDKLGTASSRRHLAEYLIGDPKVHVSFAALGGDRDPQVVQPLRIAQFLQPSWRALNLLKRLRVM